jgi:hypothetical protein
MDDKTITAIVTVLTAVVGVAIIATLVSGQAQTANVLTAGAKGFATILGAATAPVSSSSFNPLGGAGLQNTIL